MNTRVYFNLNKRRLSIQEKRRNKNGQLVWKVVEHAFNITLTDATFRVSEAGRQRVIREKRKNVHAFVEGMRAPMETSLSSFISCDLQVFYNPYKAPNFFDYNQEPIKKANLVLVQGDARGYSIHVTQ